MLETNAVGFVTLYPGLWQLERLANPRIGDGGARAFGQESGRRAAAAQSHCVDMAGNRLTASRLLPFADRSAIFAALRDARSTNRW